MKLLLQVALALKETSEFPQLLHALRVWWVL
uniref:Uncharacterized protein n=1 Tax=Anguilla anguilla TaxID=7936 RepID=A0A0E9TDT2_ANGAN